MDKAAILRERVESNNTRLLRPLLRCFTPEEACEFFDLDFLQPKPLQEKVLERIVSDMANRFEDCHIKLTEDLLSRFDSLKAPKRISWAHCLESFCYHCDAPLRQRITRMFLNSVRGDFRNRAYNILERFWDEEILPDLVKVWSENCDYGSTLLLCKRSAPESLQEYAEYLYRLLRPQHQGMFFSRLYEVDKELTDQLLVQLKEDDAITYAYVLAKLGLSLTESDALQILEENKDDDRIGILVWALSTMKFWNILMHIDANVSSFPYLFTSYGLGSTTVFVAED